MEAHRPEHYIGGVYIREHDVWCGEFHVTAKELLTYAEHDVNTIEEYDLVLTMLQAQQEYLMWWESMTWR
jgi:hypothetical protein